jgi:uncharacterized membrane protein
MSDQSQRPNHWQKISKSTQEILNVRSEVTKHRQWPQALVDWVGSALASPKFFIAMAAFHLLWVVLNLPIYPAWYKPWDPYPFTFLATIASVEAPFIALLVLMRQQRDSHIEELREEIDLQVSLHLERQSTVLLRLVDEIQKKLGVETEQDREVLENMEDYLDPEILMENLRRHLSRIEEDETTKP